MGRSQAIGLACNARRCAAATAVGVVVGLCLATSSGCGRAGEGNGKLPAEPIAARSPAENSAAIIESAPPEDGGHGDKGPIARLELLRRQGQFEQFIDATLNAAAEAPNSAPLQWLAAEAHLAAGRSTRAESTAHRAATLSVKADDTPLAVQALRLWIVARLRQGQSLDSTSVDELLGRLPIDNSGAQLIRFWVDALSHRTPFAQGGSSEGKPFEVPSTKAADGTIWADLNAIEATANGVSLPMVFVDTGTQHTIMTRRAAESAGVLAGESGIQLVGFAGLEAQPAVLETLELGELTLHNVPVLVGNSAPLFAANGQMAIGTELMHHVRFTMDYPARRVLVQRADRPLAHEARPPGWAIPLWTFSQACLTRGETSRGTARVLIDTGNRTGTYVSGRWARKYLPRFRRAASSLVFKFRHQGLTLDTMELGGATLRDWPIWDRIPRELERIDMVDVLVGRDLLWSYKLTIDLRQRVLWIDDGPLSPAPPADTIP